MENNLDKLFKSKLGGQEPEFHPAAWDRMEGLLDEAGMVPAQKKKSNRSRIIYLSLLFIGILFSLVGYNVYSSSDSNGEGSTIVDSSKSKLTSKQTLVLDQELVDNSSSSISNQTSLFDTDPSTTIKKVTANNELEKATSSHPLKRSNERVGLMENANTKTTFQNTVAKNSKAEFTNSNQVIINNAIQNNQTKTPSSDESNSKSENEIGDNKNAGLDLPFENSLTSDGRNSNISESMPEIDLNITTSINEKTNNAQAEERFRTKLIPIDNLKSKSSYLLFGNRIITPQIHKSIPSLFEIGIQASTRFNDGMGYSIGSYLSYNIGGDFAVSIAGQFDAQNFGQGPELSVFDKVYSFGSKLIERKYVLSNQKSIRMPITLRKTFSGFGLYSGVILNKVLVSEGALNAMEGSNESIAIDHELIKPLTASFQLGAAVSLSRYMELNAGLEYKPKAFATDPATTNSYNKYYPSLGLRYKLFKF